MNLIEVTNIYLIKNMTFGFIKILKINYKSCNYLLQLFFALYILEFVLHSTSKLYLCKI
jgi:hypothetical protein